MLECQTRLVVRDPCVWIQRLGTPPQLHQLSRIAAPLRDAGLNLGVAHAKPRESLGADERLDGTHVGRRFAVRFERLPFGDVRLLVGVDIV